MRKNQWSGSIVLAIAIAAGVWYGRSVVLQALMQHRMSPQELEKLPVSAPTLKEAYGPDPLQFGELRMPAGKGPFPVAVVVHGGCWVKGFSTLAYTAPLASALAAKGMATWNIEYREVGDTGGGWPGSFTDWGTATDHLRELAKRYPLDLTHVVAAGHSAGATAVLWVAARGVVPSDSEVYTANPLKIARTIAIDGPGDIHDFIGRDAEICHQPVIEELMGGSPSQVPQRFAAGDPSKLLPTGVPTALVASVVLLPEAAAAYQKAARAKGDEVSVKKLTFVGHFGMMSPKTETGAMMIDLILKAGGIRR